jgi:hypothetical protein
LINASAKQNTSGKRHHTKNSQERLSCERRHAASPDIIIENIIAIKILL